MPYNDVNYATIKDINTGEKQPQLQSFEGRFVIDLTAATRRWSFPCDAVLKFETSEDKIDAAAARNSSTSSIKETGSTKPKSSKILPK